MARVVSLVAEQTGYPAELLDLDLDLEADLGIDTVKQAELFAQIRETYGIERDDQLKLRDYPTLNHVVGFVRDRLPQPTAPPAAAASAPVAARRLQVPVGEELVARVVSLVAEQTGYPAELLDLDLDLEADLGIDTVKQAELFAQIRETYGIERDDQLKLRDYPTLNHVVGFVRDRLPQPTASRVRHRRLAAPRRHAASSCHDARAAVVDLAAPVEPGCCVRGRWPRWRRWLRWRGRSWWRGWCRWWRSRRGIRLSCWIWIWIWRRIWGSTR